MTIDTNILIAYLAGDEKIIEFLSAWRNRGGFLYISTIVEAELLSFSKWTIKERNLTQQFLEENFISVVFDRQTSRITADLRRSVTIKFPDAAIAASALFTKTPLVTLDRKDFKKIKGLNLIIL